MILFKRYDRNSGKVEVLDKYKFWVLAGYALQDKRDELEQEGFRITEIGDNTFDAYMGNVRYKYYLTLGY